MKAFVYSDRSVRGNTKNGLTGKTAPILEATCVEITTFFYVMVLLPREVHFCLDRVSLPFPPFNVWKLKRAANDVAFLALSSIARGKGVGGVVERILTLIVGVWVREGTSQLAK